MDYGIYAVGILVVLVSGGVAAWYLRGTQRGDGSGFFAPKLRRLTASERLHLEGGRKLVLVRRDDVEHLLLIGGPIDLVIESNIAALGAGEQPQHTALNEPRPAVMPFPGPREPSLSVQAVDPSLEPLRLRSADTVS